MADDKEEPKIWVYEGTRLIRELTVESLFCNDPHQEFEAELQRF